jgi:hypothetical protein
MRLEIGQGLFAAFAHLLSVAVDAYDLSHPG